MRRPELRRQRPDVNPVDLAGGSPELGANPPAPQARQCQLVLALGGQGGFVAIDKLPELSPQVAAMYARRSSRVIYRDVMELLRRGLVERTPAGVRAKKELILAFLPWRKRV